MASAVVLVHVLALLVGVAPARPSEAWCGKNPQAPVVVDADTCTLEGMSFRVSLVSPSGCWPEDDMTLTLERDGRKAEVRWPGPRPTRWWMLDLKDSDQNAIPWVPQGVCKRIDTVPAAKGRLLMLLRTSGRPGADRLVGVLYDARRNLVLDLRDVGAVGELVARGAQELWFRDGSLGETTGELVREPADEVKLPDGARIVSAPGEFMPVRPVIRVATEGDRVVAQQDLQRTFKAYSRYFASEEEFRQAFRWGAPDARTMVRSGRTAGGRGCVQPHRGEEGDAWRTLPWYCEPAAAKERPLAVAAAGNSDHLTPPPQLPLGWKALNAFTVQGSIGDSSRKAMARGTTSLSTHDLRIDLNGSDDGGSQTGSLIVVAGDTLLVRGLSASPGNEIDLLDDPVLLIRLVTAALEHVVPEGPGGVRGTMHLDEVERSRPLVAFTASANVRIPAPWRLTGTVSKDADNTIAFDLRLISGASTSRSVSGTLASTDASPLDEGMSLVGWTPFSLGVRAVKSDRGTLLDYGTTPKKTQAATLGVLRKEIQVSRTSDWSLGLNDPALDFNGHWRVSCAESLFGTRLLRTDRTQPYLATFCGTEGCGSYDGGRETFVAGDPHFRVIGANKIEENLAGRWIALRRCPQDEAVKERRPCREHPAVRQPCFTVRGRLAYWNGSPSARIWVVGTDTMLGVSDSHALPGFEQMPMDVQGRLNWETELFGSYTFCPFTPEQPGVMQLGCIQTAENLRAEKRSK